jgi:predicted nucleic acid-binding protein
MSDTLTGSPTVPVNRTLYVAEPPALYLMRPPLVVDCSALSGIVFQEPWQAQAQKSIVGRTLHAPSLLPYEITSVSLKKERRGETHVADGLAQALEMDIDLHEINAQEVFDLAKRYQLSAYDAAYLWLAAELKCPLATFDEKLATAAQAHLSTLA